MALNYAQKWEPELLKINIQETITSPFITTNVKWVGAKTFHYTSGIVSGFKNHSRDGGWQSGKYSQTDVPLTLDHDRDIEILIDVADIDETNETASIQNIAYAFQKTQSSPEMDARFFERVYSFAHGDIANVSAKAGLVTSTAVASYTKDNVFGKVKAVISRVKRYRNTLIVYVPTTVMDLLSESTENYSKIEQTQIAEGSQGTAIETRITRIDGVPVIESYDDERLYTAYKYDGADGGFTPKVGAFKINVCAVSLETTISVPKVSSIYYFAPGAHTKGDGYLFQDRQLWDTFVFPNGKDAKVDSVALDVDTVAVV